MQPGWPVTSRVGEKATMRFLQTCLESSIGMHGSRLRVVTAGVERFRDYISTEMEWEVAARHGPSDAGKQQTQRASLIQSLPHIPLGQVMGHMLYVTCRRMVAAS